MANPYAVNFGSIPFSTAPGAMFGAMGGTPAQAMAAIGPAYQSSYNAALDFNKQLGDTINTGYNTAMSQQLAGQQGILGLIDSYGQSSRNDISAANTRQRGDTSQSMISRGLGNTTILDAMNRGYNNDLARQNLVLDDQLARTRADYRDRFNQQNTMLSQQQLGFLERMTGQYPNAGLYGQLAAQFGAAEQARQNQSQLQDALNRAQQQAGAGRTMGAVGGGGNARPQSAFAPRVGGVSAPEYSPVGGAWGGTGAGINWGNYFPDLVNASDYYGNSFMGDAWDAIVGGIDGYDDGLAWGGGGDWGAGWDSAGEGYDPDLDWFYESLGDSNPYAAPAPSSSLMGDAWDALGGGVGGGVVGSDDWWGDDWEWGY